MVYEENSLPSYSDTFVASYAIPRTSSDCDDCDEENSAQRPPLFRPILLDIQMLQTERGHVIKELAYKSCPIHTIDLGAKTWPQPDRSLHYMCFSHDPQRVPSHRIIQIDNRIYDKFTGLEISGGDVEYSDERVVLELQSFNLIFVKGHNKKRLLCGLFKRCANEIPELPTIVNVDSTTRDEEDIGFCRKYKIGGANFSFKYMYRHFATYMTMMCDYEKSLSTTSDDDPIYLNNAVAYDTRFNVYARGRSLWICPHDHTCGQYTFTWQRCAALNLGLLETLWYMMKDQKFRDLLKNDMSMTTSTKDKGFQRDKRFTQSGSGRRSRFGNLRRYYSLHPYNYWNRTEREQRTYNNGGGGYNTIDEDYNYYSMDRYNHYQNGFQDEYTTPYPLLGSQSNRRKRRSRRPKNTS